MLRLSSFPHSTGICICVGKCFPPMFGGICRITNSLIEVKLEKGYGMLFTTRPAHSHNFPERLQVRVTVSRYAGPVLLKPFQYAAATTLQTAPHTLNRSLSTVRDIMSVSLQTLRKLRPCGANLISAARHTSSSSVQPVLVGSNWPHPNATRKKLNPTTGLRPSENNW